MSEDILQPLELTEDTTEPETVPEATAETPPAPEQPPAQEQPKEAPQMVPLAALQDVREENKTLKAALSRLERIEAAMAQAAPRPAPPDVFTDPEAYTKHILAHTQQIAANVEANISERMARDKWGDDAVNEAFEAAKARGEAPKFWGVPDPWGEMVRWHQKTRVAEEIGTDPAAYRAKLEAEIRAKVLAELAGQRTPTPAMPSLAGQPNLASRNAPAWSGPTPLSEIFGKRDF